MAPLTRLRRFIAEETRVTGLPIARLLTAAAILHVAVTWLAMGPWNADEHFQILEFAYARAGLAPLASLPWEFAARIRSTLQPVLAMGLLRAIRAIGITSPFVWVRLLRFGTLAVAFAVLLRVFARVSPTLTPGGRRVLWLAGLFVWFAPLFTARFTSENLSGLALATALTLTYENRRARSDRWVALLLGLSFVFRFQTAFASGALVCWILVYGLDGRRRALRITLEAAAVVGLGILLDSWFYHGWVITSWQYFRVNLVQGVAAGFGTSPWYTYFLWFITMMPPLGFVMLTMAVAGIVSHWRSPWSWTTAAFLIGHLAVAHKEFRFLLPLLYSLPVCLAMGWEALERRVPMTGWSRWAIRGLLLENLLLAVFLATPWGYGSKDFDLNYFRFLWKTAEAHPGKTVYLLTAERGPYATALGTPLVYSHPRVHGVRYVPGDSLPAAIPRDTPPADILVMTRIPAVPSITGAAGYTLVYESEPGYRTMTRWFGLENSRWIPGLDVDEWWQGGRRVYRVVMAR